MLSYLTFQFRVTEDDDLFTAFYAFADDYGLDSGPALRAVLRAGLHALGFLDDVSKK